MNLLEDLTSLSAIPAIVLLGVTSLVLLLSSDWRLSLLALSLQYLGVFFLILIDWSFAMSAVKLIAGWMAAAILGIAILSLPSPEPGVQTGKTPGKPFIFKSLGLEILSGRVVALLTAVLVWLMVITFAPRMVSWVPDLDPAQAWGGMLLIGMGLFQLGFSSRPFSIVLGLLTFMAGFEILYSVIEPSALVTGLLAGITLAIALVGAYLQLSPNMEEDE